MMDLSGVVDRNTEVDQLGIDRNAESLELLYQPIGSLSDELHMKQKTIGRSQFAEQALGIATVP